jgi:hypothetical protein
MLGMKKPVSIVLSLEQYDAARQLAEAEGRSLSAFVRRLVVKRIDRAAKKAAA